MDAPRECQRVILAKPYLTVVLEPSPRFPVLLPIPGHVLKCVDVEPEAAEKCAAFVEMHQPRCLERVCGVRDMSTERYLVRSTANGLANLEPADVCTGTLESEIEPVSYVTIERKSAAVTALMLGIHHTCRELLFPALPLPEDESVYRAALVYEGNVGLYEHAVRHFGLQTGTRARTVRAPQCTITTRDGDVLRHAQSRAALSMDVGGSPMLMKNPHIVTISVRQAACCTRPLKYGGACAHAGAREYACARADAGA
ncbi:MC022L [Molluscum contagiosum virus subtype 1]|uniref:MC022L n=4 Tax=Molluscum contagiosum virus TaxID=10279 RepID=Q98190_MCV1|nr:MC022L [Molluscum contagiosum virus subtype 1]AZT86270.1 MC022L [Molluscum contagiosum virus]AAC55150.1 MC022L [Molluscum contagiosum virus subtype 1]AQY16765.1 MC022 [Molluscum contagiosum virus subtype 1]AQY16945.1 MC022 [Molluscum contagiosum virus subtype 1]AQY17124.1 MC022 [Molluscum contagiosum virus subtype 1]